MAFEFKFPDVGEGITEGEIIKWKVKVGDNIKVDQVLVEVETDKAVVDIPSPKAGKILRINHKEGESINVGEVLVVIGEEGEKVDESKEKYTGSVVGFLEEAPDDDKKTAKKPAPKKGIRERVKATPKVRALAKELGVDLFSIKGTGPNERITEDDIRKASSGEPPKIEVHGIVDRYPLKGLRKKISEQMVLANTTTVAVTNHYDADVTKLFDLRKKEKKTAEKKDVHLTFLPFIVKALIAALKNYPMLNSSLEGEDIIVKKYYNIGIAVDTEQGLIVPVVKDADKKNIFELASEITNLAQKAKSRSLSLDEMKGGSFTITNLGAVGVKYFTPVINYPESAILGPGKIEEQPVVHDGEIIIRKIMPLSITYDHRIVDGAEAARFMADLISFLEDPATMFIDE